MGPAARCRYARQGRFLAHGMSEGTPAAPAGSQASYQVTLVADVAAAEAISSRLEEAVEPQALAVSLFDRRNGRFEISALYAEPPRQDAVIALIGAEAA